MSPQMKSFVPHMAAAYGFEYQFVTYKWPSWLHKQVRHAGHCSAPQECGLKDCSAPVVNSMLRPGKAECIAHLSRDATCLITLVHAASSTAMMLTSMAPALWATPLRVQHDKQRMIWAGHVLHAWLR